MKHMKLNRDAVIVADPQGDLFAVTIHPKYGWLTLRSRLYLVQAATEVIAMRHALAENLIRHGDQVQAHPKCVQAQLVARLTDSTPGESSR